MAHQGPASPRRYGAGASGYVLWGEPTATFLHLLEGAAGARPRRSGRVLRTVDDLVATLLDGAGCGAARGPGSVDAAT